jgi:hypothetical protein
LAFVAFLGALAPFFAALAFLLGFPFEVAIRGFCARALAFLGGSGFSAAVAVAWAVSWVSVVDVVM